MVGRNILDHAGCKDNDFIAPSRDILDLTDFDATFDYIKRVKPDMVINAAGYVGGIRANLEYPLEFLMVNLDIGRNLVSAAYKNNVKKLLNLGASCMYPRNAPNPLKEDMFLLHLVFCYV